MVIMIVYSLQVKYNVSLIKIKKIEEKKRKKINNRELSESLILCPLAEASSFTFTFTGTNITNPKMFIK